MHNDSIKKTLIVALGVCLVCSVLVSGAYVALKGKQDENKKLDKLKNILIAGKIYEEGEDIEKKFEKSIETAIINLETGEEVPESEWTGLLNPKTYDVKKVAQDKELGTSIKPSNDLADIKRRPVKMVVYKVMNGEKVDKYILPIYGKGLWSTMYGFIALNNNLKKVEGITFYEHGETPGLGGEIDNPNWKSQWVGKKVFNEQGEVELTVLKGKVDPSSDKTEYRIDGLSGSTLTSRGVDNTIKYWLGDKGYGKFFERLKGGGLNEQV